MKVRALPLFGSESLVRWNAVMKQIRQADIIDQEPLGIIISRGSRVEDTPRFAAYIWGPVPSPEAPTDEPKPVAA